MLKRALTTSFMGLALTASCSVFADSVYESQRSGGVDATGGNTGGSVTGYRSASFDELASLSAPTVDMSVIEGRITNAENNIQTNITNMQYLSTRITGAQSSANTAYNRANSAYSKASSAASSASSAISIASSGVQNVKVTKTTRMSGGYSIDSIYVEVDGKRYHINERKSNTGIDFGGY